MQSAPLQSAPIGSAGNPDRRTHPREKLRSVAYVDLGPGNGGVLQNVSETGLAVSLAMQFASEELLQLNFRLPEQEYSVKVRARVAWIGKSRKEAGLHFQQLRNRDLRRIREWIAAEHDLLAASETSSAFGAPSEGGQTPQSDKAGASYFPTRRATTVFDPGPASSAPAHDSALLNSYIVAAATERKPRSSVGLIVAAILLAFAAGLFVEHELQHGKKTEANTKASDRSQELASAIAEPSQKGTILSAAANSTPQQTLPAVPAMTAASNPQPSAVRNASASAPGNPESTPDQTLDASTAHAHGSRNRPVPSPPQSERHQRQASLESLIEGNGAGKSSADSALPSRNPSNSSRLAAPSLPALPLAASAQSAPTNVPVSTRADPPSNAATPANTSGDQSLAGQSGARLINSEQSAESDSSASPPASLVSERASFPLVSASVSVHAPPSPSIRIRPEMQSSFASGGQKLQMGQVVSRVQPIYPQPAITQGIQGSVKAHLTIGADGTVENVQADGPPLLAEAATSALQQWRFRPTLLNGTAIGAGMDVVLVFQLSPSSPTR
jgi:TonB family protein